MQAMHLAFKALEKYAIPKVLPPELMPPGKRKDITISNSSAPIGMTTVPPPIPPLPNVSAVKRMASLEISKVLCM